MAWHDRSVSRAPAAVELTPLPVDADARTFSNEAVVRLGDVDPSGRLRLDSTARLLQDVATDDSNDAGLGRGGSWMVRRTMIVTTTPARLREPLTLTTWCSALGPAWAERRTRLTGDRGAAIEAVSLWVQIDPASIKPTRLQQDFVDTYASAASGRTVSARLSLPDLDLAATAIPWHVRRSDLDPYDHVNNAASWTMSEEAGAGQSRAGRSEIEYLGPVVYGADTTLSMLETDVNTTIWLVQDGIPRVTARHTP